MNGNEIIPFNIEEEQAVLGALIEDNGLVPSVMIILTPDSFYKGQHRIVYQSILDLFDKNEPIDEITIGANLESKGQLKEVGGYAYLAGLIDCSPSAGDIAYYSKLIKQDSVLRNFITIIKELEAKAKDPKQGLNDLLIEAETKISDISKQISKKSSVRIEDAIGESMRMLEERYNSKSETVGIPTGFYDLDKVISGLIAPNVITVAADSGVGKTTFALNIIENIYTKTDEKRATVVFSREMANYQLSDRFICSTGKIDAGNYKTGKLSDKEFDKVAYAAGVLSKVNVILNDEVSTIDQMIHEIKYLHRNTEGGLCLVVIDYLQLIEGVSKSNREQEISYISRSIKRTAKDLNIPIMPLSQLNRDARKRTDKRPIRSDLRESAAIEHDSDIILFLYRDEFYDEESKDKGVAEVKIDKHRNGDTGTIYLRFKGEYNKFENASKYDQNPY